MINDDVTSEFRLIPLGEGFISEAEVNWRKAKKRAKALAEDEKDQLTAQVETWQNQLLKAYKYKTTRQDEYADILAVKAGFINNMPEKLSDAKGTLSLLACDQSTIFLDADRKYRSKKINAKTLSAQSKMNREYRKSPYRNDCIERALEYYPQERAAAARVLLNIIVWEASIKHTSVYDWLYSKSHVRKGIRVKSEINSLWDNEKLDMESCQKDFKRLLSASETELKIEMIDCDRFIAVLAAYAQEQKRTQEKYPEQLGYRDETMDFVTVPALQRRLDRLGKLEEGYSTKIELNECLYNFDYWGSKGKSTNEKTAEAVERIRLIIHQFFDFLNLSYADDNDLTQRICWVMNLAERKAIPKRLTPIFLLNMMMACQRKVFRDPADDDTAIPPNEILNRSPLCFPKIALAKQRYAQLSFLISACKALETSEGSIKENLKEFVGVYGNSILSYDEITFWRQQLKDNYEALPQIGFQLCFLNYCEQCVPPYYEKLNYCSGSKLQRGGYHNFFVKNRRRLHFLSKHLFEDNQSIVRKYRALWKRPEKRDDELKKLLSRLADRIPLNPSLFCDWEQYKQEELTFLVWETMLQMEVRKNARKNLLSWFSKCYGNKLAMAYNKRITQK